MGQLRFIVGGREVKVPRPRGDPSKSAVDLFSYHAMNIPKFTALADAHGRRQHYCVGLDFNHPYGESRQHHRIGNLFLVHRDAWEFLRGQERGSIGHFNLDIFVPGHGEAKVQELASLLFGRLSRNGSVSICTRAADVARWAVILKKAGFRIRTTKTLAPFDRLSDHVQKIQLDTRPLTGAPRDDYSRVAKLVAWKPKN